MNIKKYLGAILAVMFASLYGVLAMLNSNLFVGLVNFELLPLLEPGLYSLFTIVPNVFMSCVFVLSIVAFIVYLVLSKNAKAKCGIILGSISAGLMLFSVIPSAVFNIFIDTSGHAYYVITKSVFSLIPLLLLFVPRLISIIFYFVAIIKAVKAEEMKNVFKKLLVAGIAVVFTFALVSQVKYLIWILLCLNRFFHFDFLYVLFNFSFYFEFAINMIGSTLGSLFVFIFVTVLTIRTLLTQKGLKKLLALGYPVTYIIVMMLGSIPQFIANIIALIMVFMYI